MYIIYDKLEDTKSFYWLMEDMAERYGSELGSEA